MADCVCFDFCDFGTPTRARCDFYDFYGIFAANTESRSWQARNHTTTNMTTNCDVKYSQCQFSKVLRYHATLNDIKFKVCLLFVVCCCLLLYVCCKFVAPKGLSCVSNARYFAVHAQQESRTKVGNTYLSTAKKMQNNTSHISMVFRYRRLHSLAVKTEGHPNFSKR